MHDKGASAPRPPPLPTAATGRQSCGRGRMVASPGFFFKCLIEIFPVIGAALSECPVKGGFMFIIGIFSYLGS
jgi:hypothetical protein